MAGPFLKTTLSRIKSHLFRSRHCVIEEGFIQKIRQRSSLLLGVTKIFQFLFFALAILPQDQWKNIGGFAHKSLIRPSANQPFLRIVLVQNSQRGKKLKQFFTPRSSDDLCLLFCINPSVQYRPKIFKDQEILGKNQQRHIYFKRFLTVMSDICCCFKQVMTAKAQFKIIVTLTLVHICTQKLETENKIGHF